MVTLDLGAPLPPHLPIARANAIQDYASLEASLCMVFADLLGTQLDLAGIVFFRITNTHSRNTIMSSLMKEKHGTTYRMFWEGGFGKDGVVTLLRQLDQQRNEIVHWHVTTRLDVDKVPQFQEQTLIPANVFKRTADQNARITVQDLLDFSAKALFVTRLLNTFWMVTSQIAQSNPLPAAQRQTWHNIFAQPVLYPPPGTHPLSPNYKGPEISPPPSQA